jgi:hypothetical protein
VARVSRALASTVAATPGVRAAREGIGRPTPGLGAPAGEPPLSGHSGHARQLRATSGNTNDRVGPCSQHLRLIGWDLQLYDGLPTCIRMLRRREEPVHATKHTRRRSVGVGAAAEARLVEEPSSSPANSRSPHAANCMCVVPCARQSRRVALRRCRRAECGYYSIIVSQYTTSTHASCSVSRTCADWGEICGSPRRLLHCSLAPVLLNTTEDRPAPKRLHARADTHGKG